METKHTKGEWILNESRSEIVSSNDCSKNGGIDIIAQCYSGFNYESTIDECKANAKLIAAAPELLEALIEINDFVENMVKAKMISPIAGKTIKNRATNVIKKATE